MYTEASAVAYKVSSREFFQGRNCSTSLNQIFHIFQTELTLREKQKSVEVRKRVSLILDMQLIKCHIRPFNAPTQDAAVTVKPFFGKRAAWSRRFDPSTPESNNAIPGAANVAYDWSESSMPVFGHIEQAIPNSRRGSVLKWTGADHLRRTKLSGSGTTTTSRRTLKKLNVMRRNSAQPWLLKKSFTPLVRGAKTVLL
jgi:hypothetical protein